MQEIAGKCKKMQKSAKKCVFLRALLVHSFLTADFTDYTEKLGHESIRLCSGQVGANLFSREKAQKDVR